MDSSDLKTQFLTGIAVIVPIAVSVWVLLALTNIVGGLLAPIGTLLRGYGIESGTILIIIQAASALFLSGVILLIGIITQHQIGETLVSKIDSTITNIPGIGSIYKTTRKMSDLVLDPSGEGTQFREVKLVEFPAQDTYTLAFLTSSTPPDSITAAARDMMKDQSAEYATVFLPMAPNPVMGGHLTHVPERHVHDVDMTVEQAVQYILTTGIVDATESLSD